VHALLLQGLSDAQNLKRLLTMSNQCFRRLFIYPYPARTIYGKIKRFPERPPKQEAGAQLGSSSNSSSSSSSSSGSDSNSSSSGAGGGGSGSSRRGWDGASLAGKASGPAARLSTAGAQGGDT